MIRRMAPLAYVFALLVAAAVLQINCVQARLDVYQLAVGDWKVQLRCHPSFYESWLYPTTPTTATRPKQSRQPKEQPHVATTTKNQRRILPRVGWLRPLVLQTKEYPCQLSIFPNGTFALRPSTEEDDDDDVGYWSDWNSKTRRPQRPSLSTQPCLMGRWNAKANPYCVTDRFYDELHLTSNPRRLVRRKMGGHRHRHLSFFPKHKDAASATTKKRIKSRRNKDPTWNQLSLQLHCRIRGRYASPGPLRRLFALQPNEKTETTASLTHGVLVWQAAGDKKQQQPQSDTLPKTFGAVGASFSGKRMVQRRVPSRYEVEDDQAFFGY